jgi:hypothetical protein
LEGASLDVLRIGAARVQEGGWRMLIPKRLGHIWIGPLEPPHEWMQTWKDLHPDWKYTLYDNDFLASGDFETHAQIGEYLNRGSYAGAADLLRYEILYKFGGYLAAADSICLHSIDELLANDQSLYTVYENEFVRGHLVSPIAAATPGHPFIRLLIDRLKEVDPADLDVPWKQTGNLFVAEMIEEHQPDIVIWPSHYLIPVHYTGRTYKGTGKIYAEQLFGSTKKSYKAKSLKARILERSRVKYHKAAHKRLKKKGKTGLHA